MKSCVYKLVSSFRITFLYVKLQTLNTSASILQFKIIKTFWESGKISGCKRQEGNANHDLRAVVILYKQSLSWNTAGRAIQKDLGSK